MAETFAFVNEIFSFVVPLSDFFWDFPKNFEWYKNIPVLGNFSLALICIVGGGIYFTVMTRGIQFTYFVKSLRELAKSGSEKTGISPLSSLLLSSAMRIGPGNMLGVMGAISVGGAGSLFWMWVSACFAMAMAFAESTLAQIFKEKKDDEFIGGLPFYGQKLLGGVKFVGVSLSLLYVTYAMFNLPAQGYNVISTIEQIGATVTGGKISGDIFSGVVAIILLLVTTTVAFGGMKRAVNLVNKLVPFMAITYFFIVVFLVISHFELIPFFFRAVLVGAFSPESILGGSFGVMLMQGVKRGLMSNEAGQGTITMAAACSNAKHPCEQGLVQAIGVFIDTIVICTCSGFVVVMSFLWMGVDEQAWLASGMLTRFLTSAQALAPAGFENFVASFFALCVGLFSFTTLIGLISFSEVSINIISREKNVINAVRVIGIFFAAFGIICALAKINLGNIWAIGDLTNILMIFANLPLLVIGTKYILRATRHYKIHGGKDFNSSVIGWKNKSLYWDDFK